jgi:hypothetical protein
MGRSVRRRSTCARSNFRTAAVCLLEHGLGLGTHLGRLRGQDAGHRARLPEFLVQGLAIASG